MLAAAPFKAFRLQKHLTADGVPMWVYADGDQYLLSIKTSVTGERVLHAGVIWTLGDETNVSLGAAAAGVDKFYRLRDALLVGLTPGMSAKEREEIAEESYQAYKRTPSGGEITRGNRIYRHGLDAGMLVFTIEVLSGATVIPNAATAPSSSGSPCHKQEDCPRGLACTFTTMADEVGTCR